MRFTLRFPVGRGVKNHPDDTLKVQDALNGVPVGQGRAQPPLDPDGKTGPKTIEAIQKFQLKHFGWKGADGRVDVEGPTHRKLNELLEPGITSSPAPVEPEPTSESFSMRLSGEAGGDYKDNLWHFLITDEANVRSKKFWLRTGSTIHRGPLFIRHWGPAHYFRIGRPVPLSGFGGAGVEFLSILTKTATFGIEEVDGELSINHGENWYNEMAMKLNGDDRTTFYWNTPFKILDCWADCVDPPNNSKPGIFTHRLRGHLIPSPELVTGPLLAARPMSPQACFALRQQMRRGVA